MMQKNDIVIAWVDGSDAEWKRRRSAYIEGHENSGAADDTRFASNNEIYFCIASILKFVPFSGNIFVVADRQKPEFIHEFYEQGLCSKDKIRIVDHREIFTGYDAGYPSFNSLSIESLIWRIKGLSKYFIYLNDDFFFNAPAEKSDFLISDNVVAYGRWQSNAPLKLKMACKSLLSRILSIKPKSKHTVSQMLGADVLGYKKFFKLHHYPHVMDAEALEEFFRENPELLEQQVKHRFRSIEQINPVSLALHLKIQKKESILYPEIPVAYLKNEQGVNQFLKAINSDVIKYGCIQSLDQLSDTQKKAIYLSMEDKFKNFLPSSIIGKHV